MTVDSVLVTGSSGMVGTALLDRLLDEGYAAYGVDVRPNRWLPDLNDRTTVVDLRDRDSVLKLRSDVDLVVHLAAHARVHRLVREPSRMMDNVDMAFNMLEFARRSSIPNFVFASSREVYGDRERYEFSEGETSLERTKSPYTASKVSGEAMVHAYRECYDLSTVIVRPSNVYGRFDDMDRVIPLFIAQSNRGQPLTVFGREKILDFTYLDDCIAGLMGVIDRVDYIDGTVLNIASGQGTSLVEVARQINSITESASPIHIERPNRGEVRRFVSDVSRARELIDFQPQYSIYEGLDRTVDWYLDRESLLDEILREGERSV